MRQYAGLFRPTSDNRPPLRFRVESVPGDTRFRVLLPLAGAASGGQIDETL
ncbi:hypothetical protein [Plantactinospora sp. GCM10030261]|uniref:hypothetical protein n=1 Tax=Plantactinospora sp. GCM10030261 TaxID=3273420 RepID=UPI00361E2B4D